MRILSNIIFKTPAFDRFDDFKKYLMDRSGLEGDRLEIPLKLLITNSDDEDYPELDEIYPLIKVLYGGFS